MSSRTIALVFAVLFLPAIGYAQIELTGTYVRYVGVGADGTMLCMSGACAGHSMQYRETDTSTASCDLVNSGMVREAFTIEATGASEVAFTNGATGTDSFTTVSPTAIDGRTITWSGTAANAGVSLRVDQVIAYEMDARFVRLRVIVTNTGTSALTNVYYLRNADPDHAHCNIGSTYATRNDVLRQPPLTDSALTTARAGDPGRVLVLGIGAHDPRARVHNGGFTNIDASTEWSAPRDGAGALDDIAVDVVFREPSLAAGASTTFELFYVWGTSEAEVEDRFDEIVFPSAPCAGSTDGAVCSSGTAIGSCRAGRCCTGCFDGTRCRLGVTETACGIGGGTCGSCTDSDPCTSDACTSGTCGHPPSAIGTACDDGAFCTSGDACNGAGVCAGTTTACDDREECTTDTCDEALDRCTSTARPDGLACAASARTGICDAGRCCTGCFEAGLCVPGNIASTCGSGGGSCASCSDGVVCTSDVCTGGACSNPPAPTSTACDDGVFCTTLDRCDGLGACLGGGGPRCDDRASCTTDACDEDANVCRHTHTSGCLIGGGCVEDGTINDTYACQACDAARDATDWSPRAEGSECAEPYCALGRIATYACNTAGMCAPMPPTDCPSGSCSDDAACGDTCIEGGCAIGTWCDPDLERCAPQSPAGGACDRDEACRAGLSCADGVCCSSACRGVCESCNARGACVPTEAGTDPDGDCHPGDVCDGDGQCMHTLDAAIDEDAGTEADAGADAGLIGEDAGSMNDGGMIVEDGGCGCRASKREAPSELILLVLLGWLARRRRALFPR